MTAHDWSISLRDIADAEMPDARLILHEIFQRRARAEPDAVAVRFEDSQLTYGGLNSRANQLARHLAAQGLGFQDRIAIWLEPGHERVVALLAVLKLGAVACPLHLSLPAKLLVAVVARVRAGALLTSSAALEKLAPAAENLRDCCIINVRASRALIATQAGDDLDHRARGADLAYIVHTSGSTGAPKAVAMSHKAFSYEISWQVRQSDASRPLTTLQFSSLGFDLFLTEVMSTLCQGGTLVVATEPMRNSSASLLDAIAKYRIERLLITRVVLQGLAEEVMRRDELPASLKEIMCTGEQLTITAQMRRLFKRHGCLFYNEYGMSESPVVSAHVLQGDPDTWPDVPPAGKLAPGSEAFILDDNLRPVAHGEQGEVYVAGNFLADGYLAIDDEASEKFQANPFGPGLLFRSGDVGRFSPEHELVLLGRLDGVVNVRGIRIGLGEIESVLRNHPLVKEAAVLKVADGDDARLVAYVTLRERHDAFESILRQWLAERVASYAIPAQLIEMEEFPRTHSGKIDRRALPLPDAHPPRMAAAQVAADTLLEAQLLAIWQNVLKVGAIGVQDKLLDRGGTSLSVQELLRDINRELNISLAATDLFRFPSVNTLARHIATTYFKTSHGQDPLRANMEEGDTYLSRRARRREQQSLSRGARHERDA